MHLREGQPCPRCGRPIRRIVVGGRATHFCSWCQRLPAAGRVAARAILAASSAADRGAGGRAPLGRRGPRWTETAPEGALALSAAEVAAAAARTRSARTRQAATTRRAAARVAGPAVPPGRVLPPGPTRGRGAA